MPTAKQLAQATALAAAAAAANHVFARAAEAKVPPVGRFADANGERIHYLDRGDGPSIVYLHGAGAMVQEVLASGLVERLSSNHRVIVPDRLGYGHSSRNKRPASVEHQADTLAALLDRIAGTPALLVGHSWGALLAAATAIRHPGNVCGLVLVSGYYYPLPRVDSMLGLLLMPLAGGVMRHTLAPVVGRAAAPFMFTKIFAPNAVTASFRRCYSTELAVRPDQLRSLSEDAGQMPAAARSIAPSYPQIKCATAILAGEADRIVRTADHAPRLAQDIPGSRLTILPEVGHMLPHVATEAVLEAVEVVASAGRTSTSQTLIRSSTATEEFASPLRR